ncbi:hypothetical protein [Salmonella phage SSBI34]|nr:hypothetical protein [Salmonella phage SSBI34]
MKKIQVNNVLAPQTILVLVQKNVGKSNTYTTLYRSSENKISHNVKNYWGKGWDSSFSKFFVQNWHEHWLPVDISNEKFTHVSIVRPNDKSRKIKRWIKNATKRLK